MKKSQKKKKAAKTTETPNKTELQKEDEKSPDYGGLPARDLKKNLGCG